MELPALAPARAPAATSPTSRSTRSPARSGPAPAGSTKSSTRSTRCRSRAPTTPPRCRPATAAPPRCNPFLPDASPFGWHDTNGVAGAESTLTIGNNAQAYTDTDANNAPDAGSSPDCTASLNCTFPLDLTLAPSAYRPGAVANLFYWNNIIHDVTYVYGFDEVGGNFQVNNYGNGGLGSDSVQAEAQDGAGTNNANFGTPVDGQRPRMQMFTWTAPTPDRDGDIDNGIIAHEYGHGISNRLVGGPGNVDCLDNNQQPGEGLSDWWSMFLTQPNDTSSAARLRGIGTYALNQPVTGIGIRQDYYDGDPAVNAEPQENTWTYQNISGAAIPHGVGSRWAQAYWQVSWALIDARGYNPDLYDYTGTLADAGNIRAMFYIIEGLKNTVCSPAFTDVRDGILAAAASPATAAKTSASSGRPSPSSASARTRFRAAPAAPRRPTASTSRPPAASSARPPRPSRSAPARTRSTTWSPARPSPRRSTSP